MWVRERKDGEKRGEREKREWEFSLRLFCRLCVFASIALFVLIHLFKMILIKYSSLSLFSLSLSLCSLSLSLLSLSLSFSFLCSLCCCLISQGAAREEAATRRAYLDIMQREQEARMNMDARILAEVQVCIQIRLHV